MLLDDIIAKTGAEKNGKGWRAPCPAHDDQYLSLAIDQGDKGPVLHCHGGCTFDAVMAALGVERKQKHTHGAVVRETPWDVRFTDGALAGTHVRLDHDCGHKTFVWRGHGNRSSLDMPFYGSHLLTQDPIIVVEGEKACDSLRARGFNALGTVTGASGTPNDLSILDGRTVFLWPDNDAIGRKHMERIRARAPHCHMLVVPGPEKSDAADYTGDVHALLKVPDPEPVTQPTNPTDLGNARHLVQLHGRDLKHTAARGWHVWDTTRWAIDETGEAMRRAKAAAESHEDQKRRGAAESSRSLNATLALAATEPGIAARPKDFDAFPGLLNCPNGTLELSTGNLIPHDRAAMLTRSTLAAYDANAKCPLWDAFLEEILPDPALRDYIQRYAGYSLHGTKNAQCFAFLYGTGANGKSTLLDVLCTVLGDYAVAADFACFLKRDSGQATNDLARLAGARLVRASEPDEGVTISESTLKQATGGEPITARFLHKEFFEFTPEFALWLSGNHQPRVKGTDHGIWRRIHLVPFKVKIERPNPTLKDQLLAEDTGILAWAVRGYQRYLVDGLTPPTAVTEATAEYRKDQDSIGQFLDDCCTLGIEQKCYATDLRSAYSEWCKANDEHPLSMRAFGLRLRDRGCAPGRGNAGRFWTGLGLTRQHTMTHDGS